MATTCVSNSRRRTEQTPEFHSLAPMQEGMLFHSLRAPRDGFEIEQIICDCCEPLDAPALRRAWEYVVSRHDALRTRFDWTGCAPVQQAQARVPLPWSERDWGDLSGREREDAFVTFLQADRERGFDPTHAPLLRLTLLRLGERHFSLIWTFHHALLDGRSFSIVLREVFATYEAFTRGEEIALPPARPYREHIDRLAEQNFDRAGVFWRARLKGFTAPTPLAAGTLTDRVNASLRPAARKTALPTSITSLLKSLAQENNLTLNTLIQASWALLLSRYSGEEDVVFGATRACRHSTVEGAESMVGLFINTLPVRVQVNPASELLPWLNEIRSQWIALREFEHTPLVKVRGWSEVTGETPLFESLVVFENASLNAQLRSAGAAWLNRKFELIEQPRFPLTLAACGGDELAFKILFDPARFDDSTIVRMLGHLETLLTAMATNPRQRLGEMPMLTAEERHQLLVEWNPPLQDAGVFNSNACLHELFEAQSDRTPGAIAVTSDNDAVTYRELNRRANLVAERLWRHGVREETPVAICMERSVDLIAGIIGILKAGGAYVPIDPACPRERVSMLLDESRAPVLLTQQGLAERLPAYTADVVCIDAPAPINGEVKHEPVRGSQTRSTNLAYVIYTSGSTGKPKGVMVPHRNVARLFEATRHWFHFDETDVWTLFHSPAFDFSVWEMWGALLHGGRLVIVPYAVSRAPETFYQLLERERVTVLNQTPSAFRQLVRAEQELAPESTLALRWIIFGGEALEPSTLRPWFDRHGDEEPRLVNMYGITETTVHVTYRPLTRADALQGSMIGVPIPDLQLYILDEQRQPVPIGVPGEIYVGGAGLARGYLHRPDLTAEKFIPHPFGNEAGALLYKTGDRARFLPGRDIEYVGRVDDQIKIRGFRIEPGEVESVVRQHPSIREAAVVLREDKPGDKRLVAYVTRSGACAPVELRSFLRDRLPDYMLPAAIVELEMLPLTSNGKLDRRALPVPDQQPETGTGFVAPRTRLEQTVAGVWQELLGVKKIGLNDNFFEMGGHSLLLVQLHYRLQALLLCDVPITTLFQYPTVSALASHLENAAAPAPRKVQDRIQRIRELQEAV